MKKISEKFMEFQHKAMAAAVVNGASDENRGKAVRAIPAGILLSVGFLLLMAGNVFAVTAPTDGFGYDIYDLAVKKILDGPIGFVGGTAAVVMGGVMAVKNQFLPAVGAVLGGAAVIKSSSITESLGMLF